MTKELLCELFKTEERIKIIRYIARESTFTAVSVVEVTGTSKGHVSRYLNLLSGYGIVIREGRRYRWIENAESIQIKKMLNIDMLWRYISLPEWAEGIGVYGSVAEGMDTKESDLDIWVLVRSYDSRTEINAAKLERRISEATGMETHILILTREKLEDLRKTDIPFHESLIRRSIALKGESTDKY